MTRSPAVTSAIDQLKPCPFCGEKPTLNNDMPDYAAPTIHCSNQKCPVYDGVASASTVEIAVKEWNTRVEAQPQGKYELSPDDEGFMTVFCRDGVPVEYKEVLAALNAEAQPSPEGWQTMDTAPKDGTPILVGRNHPPEDSDYQPVTEAYWQDGKWCLTPEIDGKRWTLAWEPEGWQPLPLPPTQGGE